MIGVGVPVCSRCGREWPEVQVGKMKTDEQGRFLPDLESAKDYCLPCWNVVKEEGKEKGGDHPATVQ